MRHPDPVQLEVFRHLFAAVAEEMGITLKRTGFSPNIKERQDYSAAIFDAHGEMVAQAAHLPVHLGSMPLSVAAAIDAVAMEPGDEVILNDPYQGGTHLPDITLVRPVFFPGAVAPAWYVANRAHHADVGGTRPGSMALIDHIDDEGIRLAPQRLTDAVRKRLLAAVRTPDERLGDLAAQQSANAVGARRLVDLAANHGGDALAERARWLQDYGEATMRAKLATMPDGTYSAEDVLDGDGLGSGPIPIVVTLTIDGDEASVDFSGSSTQVAGPLNAVFAITLSATVYCFRCLAPPDIPNNSGYMRPISVHAPPGSIVNAAYPAPVFGGNVETSQRIVDVVMRALQKALPERIPAASSGTMNNVTWGGVHPQTDTPFAYYETIAGGCGGGPDGPGASGLQTHMTNTLNTPVEALEHAFPIRVERYGLRHRSGGAGQHRGGDGVVKTIRFCAPAEVTLLTERRDIGPWGTAGGLAGACGKNTLIRASGEEVALGGKASVDVGSGDRLCIETPGGGGWGDEEAP